jgi:hypothetical protein
MDRELPRTIASLAPRYQRGMTADEYEVIVVDNGSPSPVSDLSLDEAGSPVRVHRIEDAAPSPAHAANVGLGLANGDLVGLVVDGARLASPGLLAWARRGAALAARPIVTAPAWHLGQRVHMDAEASGYDTRVEDDLLHASDWEHDGYALFGVSTPAASSARGLFGPMGESSSLFMPRSLWDEVGGLDERFALPGGGMVNHDLYRRACGLPDTQLVVLLGEGTFHQFHGGAATSGQLMRDEMRADYRAVTGEDHRPPSNTALYAGHFPPAYLAYVEQSVARAVRAG